MTVAVDANRGERASSMERAASRPIALATLWVVVFLARWAYAADRTIYHLAPDEPATLGMARWLSGTGEWTMFQAATWRPGLATLLAPVFWVTDSPTTIYRSALIVNAVLGACAAVVLVVLIRRLTSFGHVGSLVTAAGIAVLPASLSASAYAWAEPLVTLTFLIGTWCVLTYWDDGEIRVGVVGVGAAVVGMTSHGRLMPFVALVTAALAWQSVRRREPVHTVAILVAAAVSVAGSLAYTGFVVDRVWSSPADTNSVGGVFGRLGSPLAVADSAIGQLWYLLVASAGVFGAGTYVIIRRIVNRSPAGARQRRDAALVTFLTLPLIGVSMVFMADRSRVDQLVYGRYNDAIVWPILAIGVAWLFDGVRHETRRTVWWLVGGIIAVTAELGLLVQQLHSAQLSEGRAESAMVAGIQIFTGSTSTIPVLRITLLSIALLVVVFAAAQPWLRSRSVLGLILGVVLLIGAAATRDLGPQLNSGESAEAVTAIDDGRVPVDAVLGARFTPGVLGPNVAPWDQLNFVLLFQWYLSDRSFAEDFGNDDDVGPYVFAPSNDALMELSGGTIVWDDPGSDMALWLEPRDD